MKRKLLVVLLSLVCAVCLVLGLSACGETSDSGTDGNTNGGSEQTDGDTTDSGDTADNTEGDSWGNGVYTLKTAYAEAQNLGYSGSLEEFIAAISGTDGKDGVGISDIEINSSGEIVITLTDNSYKNLGKISAACEHSFGAWTVGAEATCTSIGYKNRVCADCGYTEYQFTEATGHTYSANAITSDYYTHILKCTTCNETITQTHNYNSENVCEVCNHHYYSVGLEFTVCYDDDGNSSYAVSGGNCIETDIVIPSVYKGYPVTQINNSAFYGFVNIKSVTIPDSITSIGTRAFNNCTALESITISDIITSIGQNAFTNTAYYNDSANWKNNVLYIGNCLIEADENISDSCIIKTGTTAISSSAFSGCTKLTSVTIPNSVTSISSSTFSGCTKLTSVTIPNSVTSIGNYAFGSCSSLESITIPNSVTTIGDSAFFSCSSLESITIPNSVTTIGDSAFSDCPSLKSVTLGSGVTSIGDSAFSDCRSLESITIPESVTLIGNSAFAYCRTLKSITIGSGVTSIGESAFSGCNSLENINIPDSVTSIGNFAFSDCPSLKSVIIGSGVTSIGESAFSGCGMLESVTFKNTSGWYVSTSSTAASGTDVDVTDPNQNATYLTSTYNWYYWYRSQS